MTQPPRIRDERGTATIWMVTAAFAMSILVGLAVDLGGQAHAQQRTHDLAAQAARTGAEEVQAAPAIEGRYAHIDTAAAGRAAHSYLAQSGVNGAVRVRGDRIHVRATDTYRTRFLSIIGINSVRVHGDAEAELVRSLNGEER
ncbi:pilus assembly protein TadG-related protein [Nocardioides sp. NPDC004968]|uniref:TadE/TadG family type IV pilus assembly protein n=1 Tax=Nocardioides sp. NPDC004968 TaxID=3155894 RepID=UPI00339DC546